MAIDFLRAHGISGFNIPDYCIDEVTTHTLALLLSLERGLLSQHLTLSNGRFDIYAGGVPRRLKECTAGIVGFGRIGRAVAARLRMFYRTVIACDPYVSSELMLAYGVEKVSFECLLQLADTVLLHCTLNETTNKIIDKAALARMKSTTLLINTARGALIDSGALFEALDRGEIAGVGLDVFSPENPYDDVSYARIVRHPKSLVTSHRAYLSRESEMCQRRRAAEGILQFFQSGQPPLSDVSK